MATSALSTAAQLGQDQKTFAELGIFLDRSEDYISNTAPALYVKQLQEKLEKLSHTDSLKEYLAKLPAPKQEKFKLFQQRALASAASVNVANGDTPMPPAASAVPAPAGYISSAMSAISSVGGYLTGARANTASSPQKSPASSSSNNNEVKQEAQKTKVPDWAKDENYNTDKVKEKNKLEEEQRKAKELEVKQETEKEKEKEKETPTPDVSSSTSAIETGKTEVPDWAKDENYNTDKVKEENTRIETARKEAERLLIAQWSAGLPYISAQTAALMKRDATNGLSSPSDETQRSKCHDFNG